LRAIVFSLGMNERDLGEKDNSPAVSQGLDFLSFGMFDTKTLISGSFYGNDRTVKMLSRLSSSTSELCSTTSLLDTI